VYTLCTHEGTIKHLPGVLRSDNVQVSYNLLLHNGDVGVDFNGTSYSQAYHNISDFNGGGGFLVADDLGVTHDNVVAWNSATHNPGGCGVIVAGHSTAGVFGNVVAHNLLTFNGTLRKTPVPGSWSPPKCRTRPWRITP
jgi:Right handed beta helix region